MRLDELRRLQTLLDAAAGPQDVFMALRDRSLQGEARDRAVAAELRRLRALANPERFMGNPAAQDLAREIVTRLGALASAAGAGAGSGAPAASVEPPRPTTVEPPPDARAGFVVIAGANHYHLDTRVTVGELAAIHRGRCVAGPHAGVEVAAKVAIDRADDELILAEIQALRLLARGEASQRTQVPALLDVFAGGPGGRAGVLLPWIDGIDAASLRARFTAGVPPEHVIWIGRRLLSVAGFAHKLGVLHANIEPAHVLVRPHDHHVTLIDWCYAVIDPARTRQGFRVYNPDYSAPEVAEKKPPLPAADLYSIGRCMLFLLGGDLGTGALPDTVPDRLRRFVAYLTRPSPLQRPQDAFEMFRELDRTRAAIFGEHRFVELVVP